MAGTIIFSVISSHLLLPFVHHGLSRLVISIEKNCAAFSSSNHSEKDWLMIVRYRKVDLIEHLQCYVVVPVVEDDETIWIFQIFKTRNGLSQNFVIERINYSRWSCLPILHWQTNLLYRTVSVVGGQWCHFAECTELGIMHSWWYRTLMTSLNRQFTKKHKACCNTVYSWTLLFIITQSSHLRYNPRSSR